MYFSYYEKIGDTVTCIDEEIPFDIPENWCWCRLGNIFMHNTGKALNSSNTAGKALTYITTSNVYWNRFELDHLKTMPFTDDEIEKCTVQKGDLLVCEGGDIGRSAIWSFDEEIRIQNHIHRVRAYGNIEVKLYYYIFFYYKQIGKINGNGIGLQGLSSNQLHSILLPLASFTEQQRITETIDELFDVLENIEAGLN